MRPALLVLFLLLVTTSAQADMVEIRGEGFFNGTIESEEGDQVTFKDTDGKVRTLAKKDILFMERQVDAPPPQKIVQKAGQVLKKVTEKLPAKKAAPAAVKKKAPAPAAPSGGGDATGAVRAIAQAQRAVNVNNARIEQNLRAGDAIAEERERKDPRNGKFGSL